MLSLSRAAILALPLFSAVLAINEPASPTKEITSMYSSAQEAFQDLLNALPEESLQAALSGLKGWKDGVFESHHRGVEQVHNRNPALATKLIVAAVQDLKKRQAPSNGTTSAAPPPQSSQAPVDQSSQAPADQSSAAAPPASSAANAPASSAPVVVASTTTDRAVIVQVPQTTTNSLGQTVVSTTSVLSAVTASIPVTLTLTNSKGSVYTSTTQAPAVIHTTTDSAGSVAVVTSAAQFAPTAGEVLTTTDAGGRTFLTTYTPGGGKISSVKLITTTGKDGKLSTLTSYTFVDPAQATGPAVGVTSTGKPGLQTGAAVVNKAAVGLGAIGGALAMFL